MSYNEVAPIKVFYISRISSNADSLRGTDSINDEEATKRLESNKTGVVLARVKLKKIKKGSK